MFDFDVVLSKKSDLEKTIIRLPRSFYIVFSIITVILFLSIVLYGASIFSISIFILSFISLTYRESWVFDKNSGLIISKVGIGFIYKTKTQKFENIELIELVEFTKGKNPTNMTNSKSSIFEKKYLSIKIHFTNGKDITLITTTARKKDYITLMLDEIESITQKKVER